ncbi:hypothetical protein [Desulfofundulus thermocisternus]|uniref:hypothetical protein n=1 Tax=Desulfofundulus thermocisternus TaxID=42471 RepID=UPI00217DFF4F|nr:hypothetical protein [Desulfofundulus thermocisternus]MCS5696073.1 hypothetical protein [Desulfofundulus thermocisternus]
MTSERNDPSKTKSSTPTEVDLEELLEIANIRFMGERMAREDREKPLQIAKIIWEERRKIKERKGK